MAPGNRAVSDRSWRRDLAATLLIAVLSGQLLLAQCTLVLFGCFLVVSRLTRWRPLWLALPALAGLSWWFAQGLKPAFAGYMAGGSHLIRLLAHPGTLPERLRNLHEAFARWRRWLPEQLPVAVIPAATQAAVFAVASRKRRKRPYRPGALVAARRGYLAVTLRRGELATDCGCCLGIDASTGRGAVLAWPEAEAGMLCTSQDAEAVSAIGRDLVVGAIQHRKTVIIVDLDDHQDSVGLGTVTAPDPVAFTCAQVAAPLRRVAWPTEGYDPLASAGPARATGLVMAMIDWAGAGHARQLFCASYLNLALTLISAGTADGGVGGRRVLEQLNALMEPGALRARFAGLNDRPPAAGLLADRVSELAAQVDADPSILGAVAVQLAELGASVVGPVPAPSAGAGPISLAAALAGREVVHFALNRHLLGRAASMVARLAIADLIDHLTEFGDLGCRADCVVWINGCEVIDQGQLAALVTLGGRTGTAVVLGTASGRVAARLATEVNVVAVRGVTPAGLAAEEPGLADSALEEMRAVLADLHGPGCRDVLSLWVLRPKLRLLAGCRAR
jgi:hypothetical protein